MHINTFQLLHRNSTRPKHRILVMLPLLLSVIAVSLSEGTKQDPSRAVIAPLKGSIVTAPRDASRDFLWSESLALRLFPGGVVQRAADGAPALVDGGIVAASDVLFTIHVGKVAMVGLHGAFHVTHAQSPTTVAALTTPVLIRTGEQIEIIPVGKQRKFADLDSLHSEDAAWNGMPALLSLPPQYVRDLLPEAELLLQRTSSGTQVRDQVSPSGTEWILAALHPTLKDEAWLRERPQLTGDEVLFGLLLLPMSDRAPSAALDLTVRKWGDAWSEYLAAEDAGQILNSTLPQLRESILTFHDLGYPMRSKRYAQVVSSFAHPYREIISETTRSLLDELSMIANDGIAPSSAIAEPTSDLPPEEGSASALGMEPENLIATARSDLEAAGFLLMVQSVFSVVNASVVNVTAMLATPTGDRAVHFLYDVSSRLVRTITDQGEEMPYSIPLEKYKEWVRQENS